MELAPSPRSSPPCALLLRDCASPARAGWAGPEPQCPHNTTNGLGPETPPTPSLTIVVRGGWDLRPLFATPKHGQGLANSPESSVPHPQRGPGPDRCTPPHGLLPSVGRYLRAADRPRAPGAVRAPAWCSGGSGCPGDPPPWDRSAALALQVPLATCTAPAAPQLLHSVDPAQAVRAPSLPPLTFPVAIPPPLWP